MRNALIFFLFIAVFAQASAVFGQQPRNRRYQPPAGPTITPYLDYFRRDVGPLDNYHEFILPKRALRRTLQNQTAELNQLQREVNQAQTQIQRFGRTAISPTGKAARFNNYSHYYQFNRGGRR